MADVALGKKALPLVAGAHRVVRALDASDGPFVGLLVTRGDGVAVQLDAGRLAGWPGWGFGGSAHIAAPLDLVRRSDGHDVLLPWCDRSAPGWVASRRAAADPLAPGECTTLVASILRGIGELGPQVGDLRGAWWLTVEGRPVFVIGEGDDARAAGARVVELAAEACQDKAVGRALAGIRRGLEEGRERPDLPRRQIDGWERELMELASPRPLRGEAGVAATDVADVVEERWERSSHPGVPGDRVERLRRDRRASRRTRGVAGGSSRGDARGTQRLGRSPGGVARLRAAVRVVERWPAALPALGQRSERSVSTAVTTSAPGRRRPRGKVVVVAGAAAAAVLVIGLLAPGGESGEASEPAPAETAAGRALGARAGDTNGTSTPPPADAAPADGDADAGADAVADAGADDRSDGPAGPAGGETAEDAVTAAPRLLATAEGCTDLATPSCARLFADGDTQAPAKLSKLADATAQDDPSIAVVEDYGDVVVLRLSSSDGAGATSDRILVLARVNDEWLVRDVYDVADQP